MSAGFEHIDVAYATQKGIYIGYAPDALTEATADLTFSLMLAAARRIAESDRFMRQRKWKISWSPLFFDRKIGLGEYPGYYRSRQDRKSCSKTGTGV